MTKLEQTNGKDNKEVVLYALSTCVWCRKTKSLLDEIGLGYKLVEVDLLLKEERSNAEEEMLRWNPKKSFPTIVIDGKLTIVGFDEERIRKFFG